MKVSSLKNRAGNMFTTFKARENYVVNKIDKMRNFQKQSRDKSTVFPNVEYNWACADNGARVWSF